MNNPSKELFGTRANVRARERALPNIVLVHCIHRGHEPISPPIAFIETAEDFSSATLVWRQSMSPSVCTGQLSILLVLVIAGCVAAHSQTYSVLYNFGTVANGPWGPGYAGMIAQGR